MFEKNPSKAGLIIGPGSYGELFATPIAELFDDITIITHYPNFQVKHYKHSKEKTENYPLVDFLTKILWFLHNKLKIILKTKWHLYWLYCLYDYTFALILKNKQIIIGWPQISLKTLQRAKQKKSYVLLEYPMIHVNEWMKIMKEECQLLNIEHSHSLFSKKMYKRMEMEIKLSDKINVLSSFAYESFINNGVEKEKMTITPLGVDHTYYMPAAKQTEKFVVLFVGRLEILKGIHYLKQVADKLADKYKNIEFWFAGDMMEEIVPFFKEVPPNTKYLGKKNKPELLNIYQHSDVLVLPSIQESFGLVILEAMACGIPVIATTNTGGPDVISDGEDGFIIPVRNPEAIEEKIIRLYTNRREHEKMKQATRQKVLSNFTLEHYYERIRRSYTDEKT